MFITVKNIIVKGKEVSNSYRTTGLSVYTEFSEFSRKQIKDYEKAFKKYVTLILLNNVNMELTKSTNAGMMSALMDIWIWKNLR